MSAVRGRRWVEDESPPPADLRLVPAAAALWAGSLIGLLAGQVAWWTAGLALAVLVGLSLVRVKWRPGWLAIVACLAAAVIVSALRVWSQSGDPLTDAAGHGSWATLTVSVAGFPRAVDSGFVVPDNGNNATAIQDRPREDQSRWRLEVITEQAQVAGRSWESRVALTIYGQGSAWSSVTPGEQLVTSGRLAEQAFGLTGQAVLHARDPPHVTAAAPWWNTVALRIREYLSDNASPLTVMLPGCFPGWSSGIPAASTTGWTPMRRRPGSRTCWLSRGRISPSCAEWSLWCSVDSGRVPRRLAERSPWWAW